MSARKRSQRHSCPFNFTTPAHEDDSRLTNALLSSLEETSWKQIPVASNELNGPEVFDFLERRNSDKRLKAGSNSEKNELRTDARN